MFSISFIRFVYLLKILLQTFRSAVKSRPIQTFQSFITGFEGNPQSHTHISFNATTFSKLKCLFNFVDCHMNYEFNVLLRSYMFFTSIFIRFFLREVFIFDIPGKVDFSSLSLFLFLFYFNSKEGKKINKSTFCSIRRGLNKRTISNGPFNKKVIEATVFQKQLKKCRNYD